jgi:hypothetical protein
MDGQCPTPDRLSDTKTDEQIGQWLTRDEVQIGASVEFTEGRRFALCIAHHASFAFQTRASVCYADFAVIYESPNAWMPAAC